VAGNYTVTEGAEPANFSLESLTCTATTGSSGSQDGTNPAKANISVAPNGLVTCTYVNQGSGAIQVTKTAKNHSLGAGDHPLAGATFTVNGVSHDVHRHRDGGAERLRDRHHVEGRHTGQCGQLHQWYAGRSQLHRLAADRPHDYGHVRGSGRDQFVDQLRRFRPR
jgi:hypothetical protein